MSVAEMAKVIGQRGLARLAASGGAEPLAVPVEVLDARERFGNFDLLITPINEGETAPSQLGEAWVSRDKVVLPGDRES